MWEYEEGFDLVLGSPGSRTIDPNIAQALGITPWTGGVSRACRTPSHRSPACAPFRSEAGKLNTVYAEGLVVADLNGDGAPDVVLTPINWPSLPDAPVQLFLNAGDGVMTPRPLSGSPPTQQFVDVMVPGKFDLSGRLGVFLPDQGRVPAGGAEDASKLILPAASSTFRTGGESAATDSILTIGAAAADIDGDGVDDLAVFYNGSNRLPTQILRNDGTGKFANDPQALPAWVSDLTQGGNLFMCGAFLPRFAHGSLLPAQGPILAGDSQFSSAIRRNTIVDLVAIRLARYRRPRLLRTLWQGPFFRRCDSSRPPPAAGLSPVTGGLRRNRRPELGRPHPDLVIGYQHAAANQPDYVQILINNGDGTFRDETSMRIGQHGLLLKLGSAAFRLRASTMEQPTRCCSPWSASRRRCSTRTRATELFLPVTAWNTAGAP